MRMRHALSPLLPLAAALALAGVAAARASGADAQQPAVSSNWAGYAIASTDLSTVPDPTAAPPAAAVFPDVTGSWVEPRASCQRGVASGAAFWVGLGGADTTSSALEQVGTEIDCAASGAQTHRAWWEIVPSPAVPIGLEVRPGDRMSAAVLVKGTRVTLQITNLTRHTRFTKVATMAVPDLSSAEWIAESPSVCTTQGNCRGTRLANFGSVTFSRAAATGNAHMGTITDPAWVATQIELVPGAGRGFQPAPGKAGAVPTAVASDGRGFGVAWRADPLP